MRLCVPTSETAALVTGCGDLHAHVGGAAARSNVCHNGGCVPHGSCRADQSLQDGLHACREAAAQSHVCLRLCMPAWRLLPIKSSMWPCFLHRKRQLQQYQWRSACPCRKGYSAEFGQRVGLHAFHGSCSADYGRPDGLQTHRRLQGISPSACQGQARPQGPAPIDPTRWERSGLPSILTKSQAQAMVS